MSALLMGLGVFGLGVAGGCLISYRGGGKHAADIFSAKLFGGAGTLSIFIALLLRGVCR